MKMYVSTILLVLFGYIDAAAMQDIPNELSARHINSMIETYIQGNFAASANDDHLRYFDYQTGETYEDPIEHINIYLTNIYNTHVSKIDNKEPFVLHETLEKLAHETKKIGYLTTLAESDKIRIQALRLYDFMTGLDIDPEVSKQLQQLFDNKDKLDKKLRCNQTRKLISLQIKTLRHRSALAKALETGDAAQVLEACKQPLHPGPFLSLNDAIQRMISDIQNNSDQCNVLCNNASRALILE